MRGAMRGRAVHLEGIGWCLELLREDGKLCAHDRSPLVHRGAYRGKHGGELLPGLLRGQQHRGGGTCVKSAINPSKQTNKQTITEEEARASKCESRWDVVLGLM